MKDKFISILFFLFITSFFIINLFCSDKLISKTERRKLTQFSSISLDEDFMEDMDSYLLDQFIFRDGFRKLKALVNYNIFRKLDNNKIFLYNDHIFKSEYPLNEKSFKNFIEKINNVGKFLSNSNKVFYSIIPDKNYYLEDNKYLNIDYENLYSRLKAIDYSYIDLRNVLSLDDYYKTDTHWKQENLCKVVKKLGMFYDFESDCNYNKTNYKYFFGVYYGQLALDVQPDILNVLSNDEIFNAKVYYLDKEKYDKIYIENNLNNLDKYDIFLDGASSFIEIYNESCESNKELIIFRDSFASSLAPLLVKHYKKITLIDLRYISSRTYLEKIDFKDKDVLFIYSTLIVNNSYTLKD